MYCRSASKPVSGDGEGDAAAAVDGVAAGAVFEFLDAPPQALRSNAKKIGPILFIGLFRVFLIANVHDRAFRILVNDIKPAAQSRMFEKIVMRIIRKHVARSKPGPN